MKMILLPTLRKSLLNSIVRFDNSLIFIELKDKVRAKLVTMIQRKMAEAFEARRNIRPRSKSPEIKSREPSPTDQTLRVVRKTEAVFVKSNATGEMRICREEDDDEVW